MHSLRSRYRAVKAAFFMIVALACLASSCDDIDEVAEPSASTAPQTQQTSDNPETSEQSTSTSAAIPASSAALCQSLETEVGGTVATGELQEASGLAASVTYQDVYWSHNDSGSAAGVFAFNQQGDDLGFYPLSIEGVDIEDISLFDGKIYLADIGDNINSSQRRDSVFIYAFDEPTPGSTPSTVDVTTYELTYPDGPTDAEAFFVDPLSGSFVIIEKAFGLSITDGFGAKASDADIFMAKPDAENTTTLEKVGVLGVEALEEASTAPLPEGQAKEYGVTGAITAADSSPDGQVIALRTYATVWLYTRDPQQSAAEALTTTQPCEAPSALEPQGEALALHADTSNRYGFATISEGKNVPLNYTQKRVE